MSRICTDASVILGTVALILVTVLLFAVFWPLGVLAALATFAVPTYLYVSAIAKTGQTWGKAIVKLRIVGDADGQVIGWGRAIVRVLVSSMLSGAIFYLGYLWMLWDDKSQTWHDKVANSIVVQE